MYLRDLKRERYLIYKIKKLLNMDFLKSADIFRIKRYEILFIWYLSLLLIKILQQNLIVGVKIFTNKVLLHLRCVATMRCTVPTSLSIAPFVTSLVFNSNRCCQRADCWWCGSTKKTAACSLTVRNGASLSLLLIYSPYMEMDLVYLIRAICSVIRCSPGR